LLTPFSLPGEYIESGIWQKTVSAKKLPAVPHQSMTNCPLAIAGYKPASVIASGLNRKLHFAMPETLRLRLSRRQRCE